MSDLSLTIEYGDKPVPAKKVLATAQNLLGLLAAIEREMKGRKRAKIVWSVNIYSLSDRAVIECTAQGDREMGREVAREAGKR